MSEAVNVPLPTPAEVANAQNPNASRGMTSRTKRAIGSLVTTALMVNGAASVAWSPKGMDEELPNMHESPVAEVVVDVPTPDLPNDPADLRLHLEGGALNDYQRDYRTNPEDISESRQQIIDFVEQNREQLSDPDSIESVVVTGLASAENGGENFQDQNEDNIYLAGQRGFIAAAALIAQVRQELGVDLSGKLTLGAREDMLSNEQLQTLDELSTRFGYDSPKQAVDAYNGLLTGTPGDVPPELGQLFDDVLARNRGADIEIDIRTPKPQIPPTERGVPANPVMAQHTPGYVPEQKSVVSDEGWDRKVERKKADKLPVGYQKTARHQKQPRNHNFSKNRQGGRGPRGRMARTHGGNRRSKR